MLSEFFKFPKLFVAIHYHRQFKRFFGGLWGFSTISRKAGILDGRFVFQTSCVGNKHNSMGIPCLAPSFKVVSQQRPKGFPLCLFFLQSHCLLATLWFSKWFHFAVVHSLRPKKIFKRTYVEGPFFGMVSPFCLDRLIVFQKKLLIFLTLKKARFSFTKTFHMVVLDNCSKIPLLFSLGACRFRSAEFHKPSRNRLASTLIMFAARIESTQCLAVCVTSVTIHFKFGFWIKFFKVWILNLKNTSFVLSSSVKFEQTRIHKNCGLTRRLNESPQILHPHSKHGRNLTFEQVLCCPVASKSGIAIILMAGVGSGIGSGCWTMSLNYTSVAQSDLRR